MIRILHFAETINRYDFIDSVLTGLDRGKFEIASLTVMAPQNRVGVYTAAEAHLSTCLHLEFKRKNYPRIFIDLVKEIKRFRPHVLHAHHYEESILAGLAAKLTGVPVFVVGHHYHDLIYLATKGIKRKVVLAGERLANRFADKIVVPTQAVVDLLIEQGEKEEKVTSIPYGTDFRMLENVTSKSSDIFRDEIGFIENIVGLTCCKLGKEKGLQYLLEAIPSVVRRFPKFRLVMAGNGPYEENLRELVKSLDLESIVKFIGHTDHVLNWISTSDLVIQPSLSESFCQVVTESLALGTPIVVTPVGIAPEIIINGERGGYLVPKRQTVPITEAICNIIEDLEHGKEMATKGKRYIYDHLTIERTVNKYEELYENLVNLKSR